jgi:hypothetical protein
MKRTAYTIVEMLAVITITAAVMGMAIIMLAALLKNESGSRKHLELSKNLSRLDDQFRADAHAAAEADLNNLGDRLELTPAKQKKIVRYRVAPEAIVRDELDGEKIVAAETYAISDETIAAFEKKTDAGATTLVLRVEPKRGVGTKLHYPSTRIETMLGYDLRFQKANKK